MMQVCVYSVVVVTVRESWIISHTHLLLFYSHTHTHTDLVGGLDDLVLESVQSFDDLSFDKEDFGPYSFPDDISF